MHLAVAMWNEERRVKRQRRTYAILAHAFISLICGGVVLERGVLNGIVTIQFPIAGVVSW